MASLGLPWATPHPRLLPGSSFHSPLTLPWALASLGMPLALPGPRLLPGSSLPFPFPSPWLCSGLWLLWGFPGLFLVLNSFLALPFPSPWLCSGLFQSFQATVPGPWFCSGPFVTQASSRAFRPPFWSSRLPCTSLGYPSPCQNPQRALHAQRSTEKHQT